MREWIPCRPQYLENLLNMEDLVQPSCACGRKEDLLLCLDCFLRDVSCRKCCLDHHKYLPFHRIKQWNGRFFASSSLYGQGHIIYKVNRAQVIIMSPRKLRVRTHLWTVQTCSERMQT